MKVEVLWEKHISMKAYFQPFHVLSSWRDQEMHMYHKQIDYRVIYMNSYI